MKCVDGVIIQDELSSTPCYSDALYADDLETLNRLSPEEWKRLYENTWVLYTQDKLFKGGTLCLLKSG